MSEEIKEPVITAREAAQRLGWEYSTVIRAIGSGRIETANRRKPGMRRNPQWLIPVRVIERMQQSA